MVKLYRQMQILATLLEVCWRKYGVITTQVKSPDDNVKYCTQTALAGFNPDDEAVQILRLGLVSRVFSNMLLKCFPMSAAETEIRVFLGMGGSGVALI